MTIDLDRLHARIRDVSDFPEPGVVFKDVTPLLGDPATFAEAVDGLVADFAPNSVDQVVGIEARGFILAAPVAYHLKAGFIPARKPGKLPADTRSVTYDLEYGTETLQLHRDAIAPGDRVLIVDDVLATGGTAAATVRLVEEAGGEIVGIRFLIELAFLEGARRLEGRAHRSLLTY